MIKQIISVLIIFMLAHVACAETCPTISEMKHHNLREWTAFDSDNGEPLTIKELHEFIASVHDFNMAEWADDAPEGSSHCYYVDQTRQYAAAFLAKHNLQPDLATGYWKMQSGFPRCYADVAVCTFISAI